MCGIVGMLKLAAGAQFDVSLVAQMNQAQFHRGPDEGGQYQDESIALGHRRLAIIDLASGQQPMYDETGRYVLIFNGEIYNFPALRQQLIELGHQFKTHCDTEVILRGHIQWGDECVRKLDGMFAYALWDTKLQRLFLARDRLGIKPLFYTTIKDVFYFASELKSLTLLPGFDKTLSVTAIEQYFALGYVADPLCIYQHTHKLAAAHQFVLSTDGSSTLSAYWQLSFSKQRTNSGLLPTEELKTELTKAIQSHLVTEVPLGSFLSGGVDSSAVVATIAQLSNEPVKTCSIGFDVKDYDESDYANEVAARYKTDHFSKVVDSNDFALIDQMAKIYDEPFADSSALATYRVCELARSKVTVAMSGDGADELMAGYRRYRMLANEQKVRHLIPSSIRRYVFKPLGKLYPKLDWAPRVFRAKTTLQSLAMDLVEGYFHGVSLLKQAQRDALFSDEFKKRLAGYNALQLFRDVEQQFDGNDPVSLLQYIDLQTWLPGDILTKVDRASMANSLEVRVPFLDNNFVDWATTLSPSAKLQQGQGKYVLKKAMEDRLPEDLLYRPKMGFRVPLADWFRGPLNAKLKQYLNSPSMSSCGIFNMETVNNWIDQHQRGQFDHSAGLWALLMFAGFMEQKATS